MHACTTSGVEYHDNAIFIIENYCVFIIELKRRTYAHTSLRKNFLRGEPTKNFAEVLFSFPP